jgi:hypothetical protein
MWKLSPQAEKIRRQEQEKVNRQLKAQKRDPIGDYELDLRLFGEAPFGHPNKPEFLIRCWNHESETADVLEVGDEKNYWHIRMAKALCKWRRLILLGCASSGKTHRSAAYGKTVWKSRPFGTSVYLSTTSAEAGEARTWGTVKDLFNADRYRIGKIINSLRVITLDEETRGEDGEKERDYRNGIRAVLIKSGAEGQNVVGSICGRKNDQVIWICDELNFLDPGVLDARVNLFSNDFAQFVGIGNAPTEGSPLYTDAEPFGAEFPDGWRSVDKDVHEGWPTKTGYCLYFNGEKSPNMKVPRGQPPRFKKLMDWSKRDEILLTAGGEDTPVFYTQFYGFPPTVDIPDKILTWKLLHSNGAFEMPLWNGEPLKTIAGLDLGFREGGDPCVIDFCQVGRDTRGKRIASFEKETVTLIPSQKSKDAFEKQIAGLVIKECRKPERDCHDLALDVSGDGGLLLQAIEREARDVGYVLNVLAVSFSGTADDSVVIPGEKRTAKEMFDRKVTQLWAGFRVCVQNGVVRGMDEHSKAVHELCGRKFSTDEKKRWSIEKKSDFKKRLRRSPDNGDARVLALFLALKHGLSGMEGGAGAVLAEKRQERAAALPRYSGHAERPMYGGR